MLHTPDLIYGTKHKIYSVNELNDFSVVRLCKKQNYQTKVVLLHIRSLKKPCRTICYEAEESLSDFIKH